MLQGVLNGIAEKLSTAKAGSNIPYVEVTSDQK